MLAGGLPGREVHGFACQAPAQNKIMVGQVSAIERSNEAGI